jgi:hypothetical protein
MVAVLLLLLEWGVWYGRKVTKEEKEKRGRCSHHDYLRRKRRKSDGKMKFTKQFAYLSLAPGTHQSSVVIACSSPQQARDFNFTIAR